MKSLLGLLGLFCSVLISVAQTATHSTSKAVPLQPHGKAIADLELTEPVETLDQLIGTSRLILDGRVTAVLPSITRNMTKPETIEMHSLVAVTELLNGMLPSGVNTVAVFRHGSKVGDLEVMVPEDPLVATGERYIFFLVPDDRKEPVNTTGYPRYHAVGYYSGKAKIENSKIHSCLAPIYDFMRRTIWM